LVEALVKEERQGRQKARASLKSFERKDWKGWSRTLPECAGSLAVGESRLAAIAFDRATALCLLERRWRRSRSGAAWHRLRVGLKRFRYAVESFLPRQHAAWAPQLKHLQDLLGEGHDLDVLRARILQFARARELPQSAREQWLLRVAGARELRTRGYLRAGAIEERERGIIPGPGSAIGRSCKEAYVYDSWRAELARLAKVNPSDVARPTMSSASRG
jgi:CHAD domain-containing protein